MSGVGLVVLHDQGRMVGRDLSSGLSTSVGNVDVLHHVVKRRRIHCELSCVVVISV